jgi:shikimate dehydrogenase
MPQINTSTKLYGLIGMEINYSLSPFIHNYIFELINDNSIYLAFDVVEDKFENAFKGLLEIAKGLNITIPYKEKALKYLEELDTIAEKIGAVNTIYMKKGYNTDYLAIKQLVYEKVGRIDGMKCLVAGAGGAAKASSYALGDLGGIIYILNRTRTRAENLVTKLKRAGYDAYIVENLSNAYDLILNATPDSSYIPRKYIGGLLVIDLVYKPVKTPLIMNAIDKGIKVINGLEVLIRQALIAQSIWHSKDLLGLEEEVRKYICREIPSVEQ